MDLNNLLKSAVSKKASDIHISVGVQPLGRIDGDLQVLEDTKVTQEDINAALQLMLDAQQLKTYHDEWELDFSYALPGISRFRVNAYETQLGGTMAFRPIPEHVPTFQELMLTETF